MMDDESIKELWQLIYAHCDAYMEWQNCEHGCAYPGFKKSVKDLENFMEKQRERIDDDRAS